MSNLDLRLIEFTMTCLNGKKKGDSCLLDIIGTLADQTNVNP